MANQKRGFKEWRRKREALKVHVYCAGSYKIMIAKILQLPPEQWDSDLVNTIAENLDNWEAHLPYSKEGVQFKNALIAQIAEMGCERSAQEIEWVITHGSFEQFCALFKEPMRSWMARSEPSS